MNTHMRRLSCSQRLQMEIILPCAVYKINIMFIYPLYCVPRTEFNTVIRAPICSAIIQAHAFRCSRLLIPMYKGRKTQIHEHLPGRHQRALQTTRMGGMSRKLAVSPHQS